LLHTDCGMVGYGETFQSSRAVAELIHETLAQLLLGENPEPIELLWHGMFKAVHYAGYAGTEMRAISAIDIALWDLLGKIVDQPIYTLLGGACRDAIPTYNTCLSCPPFNDHERFLQEPAQLARELLSEGIRSMKIWPFDQFACNSLGQRISTSELKRGVAPIAAIRDAVGDEIEIAVEGHCCWNLPSAIRIAQAVEPYRPMWLEELMPPDSPASTHLLRDSTNIPLVTSERLMTRFGFRPVIEANAADILMLDLAWAGGLTEARKIASLAATYQLPVAPHNPVGPISHFVAAHFSASVINLFVMESVRAFYRTWFDSALTKTLRPTDGHFPLPNGPGLGTELRSDFLARPNLIRRVSSLSDIKASGSDIDRATGRLLVDKMLVMGRS
jgi:galactonate dehydratase